MISIAAMESGRCFAGRSFSLNVGDVLAGMGREVLVVDLYDGSSSECSLRRFGASDDQNSSRLLPPCEADLREAMREPDGPWADHARQYRTFAMEPVPWLVSLHVSTEMQHELSAISAAAPERLPELAHSFSELLGSLAVRTRAHRVLVNCVGDLGPLSRIVLASVDYFCLLAAPDPHSAPLISALMASVESAIDIRTRARASGQATQQPLDGPRYLGFVLTTSTEPKRGGVPSWQLDVELRALLETQLRGPLSRLEPRLVVPYASEIADLRGADELAASAFAVGRRVAQFSDSGYTRDGRSAWNFYQVVAIEIGRRIAPLEQSALGTERQGPTLTAQECSLRFDEPFNPGLFVEWVCGKGEVYAFAKSASGEHFRVHFIPLDSARHFASGFIEVPSGRRLGVLIEPGVILVEELSIECMTFAVREAWRDGYFAKMRPLSGAEIPAQTWEWPLSARGDDLSI
jgi:hypothetical protein